jgi:hypothetical protein
LALVSATISALPGSPRWTRAVTLSMALSLSKENWLGADGFVSFDKQALRMMEAQGKSARLLS